MQLVGELINASRENIASSIQSQDQGAIEAVAQIQADHHVDFIDVNAGIFGNDETRYLRWLVKTVQTKTGMPCCIDSPNPLAVEAAVGVHTGPPPLINSISLEKARYDMLLSLIAGTDWKVVALCMSDEGMPETSLARLINAEKLINGLFQNGVALDNIYVDPLVQPVATDNQQANAFLETVRLIKSEFAGVHIICGLSNISYGLPLRGLINRSFAAMAIAYGLDSAIVNPLDDALMATIVAAEALAGKDNYCMNYLTAFRQHHLVATT